MKMRVTFALLCAGLAVGSIGFGAEPAETTASEGFASYAGKDQAEFVADVNRSFAKEESKLTDRRIKTLVKVNREAVQTCPEEDRKKVLAEVFATLPMTCFSELVEDFSSGIFKFKKGEKFKTKEDFIEFASASLMRIRQRLTYCDDDRGGARSVFATVMFLKAAGGDFAAELREPFMMFILTGSHEIARKELLPAAMGDDKEKPATLAPVTNVGYRAETPVHPMPFPLGHLPELLNLLVGSDLRVKNAWDVSSPDLGFRNYWMQAGGDTGLGAGLDRVPRKQPEEQNTRPPKKEPDDPQPTYIGQTL